MKHLIGKSINFKCPICEKGDQVVRQNQNTHAYFIGCSNWPKCDFTAELPESLRMRLLGAPGLFDEPEPPAEPIPKLQIRSLLPDEKTSAISAFGDLRPCDMCEDQARYVAIIGSQRHYLCLRHKKEIEQVVAADEEE